MTRHYRRARRAFGRYLLGCAAARRAQLDRDVADLAWPAAPDSREATEIRAWLIDTTFGQLRLAVIGLQQALGEELAR